jgi:hypothetical protein
MLQEEKEMRMTQAASIMGGKGQSNVKFKNLREGLFANPDTSPLASKILH